MNPALPILLTPLLLLPVLLAAADATTAAVAQPDPTAAVVASGRQVYRQRDLDALVAVARRHAGGRLAGGEVDRLRQAITAAFTAREALVEALAALPPSLTGPGRNAFILDLLAYEAEPAAAPARSGVAATPGTPDSTIVTLPPVILSRNLGELGRRTLTLDLALLLTGDLATRLQPQAPLIRDLVLGQLEALPPAQFADPEQAALKRLLGTALAARFPDFPAEAVLIPGMQVER